MKHCHLIFLCTIFSSSLHTFTLFHFNFGKKKQEEHFKQEQILLPHATITIENMNGNITISTWKKNKFLLEATKWGTKESLKLSTINIKYTKQGLAIKTVPLKTNKDRICFIDYKLIVPETAILEDVKTNKGNIFIEKIKTKIITHATYGSIHLYDVKHSIQAHTKYGSITIKLGPLEPKQTILAQAKRGSIIIKIPRTTNAFLHATTDKGRITSDYPITLEPRTLKLAHNSFTHLKRDVRGSLGTGGNSSIKLHTDRGNVKLIEF